MTTSTLPLLQVDRLHVDLEIEGRLQPVIHDVSFDLHRGETLGLVGESGSGKSMTARSAMRLLPPKAVTQGRILFDGVDVLTMGRTSLREYYTRGVAMIFQDPGAHINPVRTIGAFITEAMRTNLGQSRQRAEARAAQLLDEVGVPDARRRLRQYPHELSGGLLQRVMIASALALEPRLLIADEPTTALDVTRQMEVMAILEELRTEHQLAMLFITHDLDLAEAICDHTAVMYAGSIVERQPTHALHALPLHPYTRALIGSRPTLEGRAERLNAVRGRPVSAFEAPTGCAFAPRCSFSEPGCTDVRPALEPRGEGHVACLRADELHDDMSHEVANDDSHDYSHYDRPDGTSAEALTERSVG